MCVFRHPTAIGIHETCQIRFQLLYSFDGELNRRVPSSRVFIERGIGMETTYTVTGELTDERTVALDEPLPLNQGKVRLVVEPLASSVPRSYREVMADIRSRQQRRGHKVPTRKEVDALLLSERESWEE